MPRPQLLTRPARNPHSISPRIRQLPSLDVEYPTLTPSLLGYLQPAPLSTLPLVTLTNTIPTTRYFYATTIVELTDSIAGRVKRANASSSRRSYPSFPPNCRSCAIGLLISSLLFPLNPLCVLLIGYSLRAHLNLLRTGLVDISTTNFVRHST